MCLAFDVKEQLKALSRACGIWIRNDCRDPKVAAWLLDPGESEKNLYRMVHNYIPQEGYLLDGLFKRFIVIHFVYLHFHQQYSAHI